MLMGTMELDRVEAFVAIVRRGGFTHASAALHLSQPAISRRVHLLERELGAPLFERIRGGAVLTEAGRAFLPHAEALLASMRDGIEAVGALRGADRGTVTLAVVGTLASTSLTARLRRFRDTYPAIDLRVRTALSREVSELVRRGDATLGLRYDADPHPDLVFTPVHDEPMVPVCSPHHRLARARRVDAKALAGERWITFPLRPGAAPEPYASALERGLALVGARASEIIPIDSLTAQKRMPEAHGGSGVRPGPPPGEQRQRRASRGHAPRVADSRHARHHPRGADPPPARLPVRRRARAHDHPHDLAGQRSPRPPTSPPSALSGRVGLSTEATCARPLIPD
jgi:DNA-binding transcriptional LysR family regulator